MGISIKQKPTALSHNLAIWGLIFNTIAIPLLTLLGIPLATSIACIIDIALLGVLVIKSKDFRQTVFSYPVIVWFLLMNYHYINAIIKHVPETDMRMYLNNIVLPICALIYTVFLIRNKQMWLLALKKIILLFFLQCILYLSITGQVDFSDRSIALEINPNILGHIAGICSIMLMIYSIRKRKVSISIIMIFLISVAIVFYTYSRNALMIVFFALFSFLIGKAYSYRNNWQRFCITILTPVVIYLIYSIVINFTELGVRFEINTEFANSANKYTTNTLWDRILGERIIYYILGFSNFLENPLTGIGLWNFAHYNEYAYPLHSEYMVQLAEGGIIGTVLYLCFVFYVIDLFRKYKNKNTSLYIQTLICFFTILYLGITARVFAYQYFFIFYGVIIGILLQNNWIEQKLK